MRDIKISAPALARISASVMKDPAVGRLVRERYTLFQYTICPALGTTTIQSSQIEDYDPGEEHIIPRAECLGMKLGEEAEEFRANFPQIYTFLENVLSFRTSIKKLGDAPNADYAD